MVKTYQKAAALLLALALIFAFPVTASAADNRWKCARNY